MIITLDGYAASNRAVRELPEQSLRWKDTRLGASRYLNNMVEQDHRGVKSRIRPMLGFKVFDRAAVTIAGVELLHRIRKGQLIWAGCVLRAKPRPRSGTRGFRLDQRNALTTSFGDPENSYQSQPVQDRSRRTSAA